MVIIAQANSAIVLIKDNTVEIIQKQIQTKLPGRDITIVSRANQSLKVKGPLTSLEVILQEFSGTKSACLIDAVNREDAAIENFLVYQGPNTELVVIGFDRNLGFAYGHGGVKKSDFQEYSVKESANGKSRALFSIIRFDNGKPEELAIVPNCNRPHNKKFDPKDWREFKDVSRECQHVDFGYLIDRSNKVLSIADGIHQNLIASQRLGTLGATIKTMHGCPEPTFLRHFPSQLKQRLDSELELVTDGQDCSCILVDTGTARELLVISRGKEDTEFNPFGIEEMLLGSGEMLDVRSAPLKGGLILTTISYYKDPESIRKLQENINKALCEFVLSESIT
jgi:hypothetical protein